MLAFDVETTTLDKGSPFNKNNKLVAIGLGEALFYKEFDVPAIQKLVDENKLIGFNIKFDIHWLRNIGISFRNASIYDCQLAEFLLTNQTTPYPSLNEVAEKYLGEKKLDIIKEEYWDKGVDTWFIPQCLLLEYLKKDLELTLRVFQIQEQLLKEQGKWSLFLLQCADLLVLEDMEFNGILYQQEKSVLLGEQLGEQIERTRKNILSYTELPNFNCNSGDHLSCLLYGGTLIHQFRVPIGTYKSGAKIGQIRYKLFEQKYEQPRLVEPLKGSALKKEGYWSTDEPTLRSLKCSKETKKLVDNILELAKLETLQSKYFFGIPKLMEKRGWVDFLHGNLNQCVARTGRLSASEPNQQNMAPEVKTLCTSRYND